ncbi:hypothetical protein C3L33_11945, partial [Rhododendron williamsianum]
MASPSSKLLLLRRLTRNLKPPYSSSSFSSSTIRKSFLCSSTRLLESSNCAHTPPFSLLSRSFCSRPLSHDGDQGPAPVDYRCVSFISRAKRPMSSLLQEEEFHKLADSTINDLLEKLEEYGDSVDIDDFDIDYGVRIPGYCSSLNLSEDWCLF